MLLVVICTDLDDSRHAHRCASQDALDGDGDGDGDGALAVYIYIYMHIEEVAEIPTSVLQALLTSTLPTRRATKRTMLAALHLLLPLLHLLLLFLSSASASDFPSPSAATATSSLVVTACAHARFPSLCVRTLAPRSPSSSADLALAATSASLSVTHGAAALLGHFPAPRDPSDRAALRDCSYFLLDAADKLARAAKELARLRPDTLSSQLCNVQTWTSAAMTGQDMCVREISGLAGPNRDAAVARVTEASQDTSNALYLITRLAGTHGRNS